MDGLPEYGFAGCQAGRAGTDGRVKSGGGPCGAFCKASRAGNQPGGQSVPEAARQAEAGVPPGFRIWPGLLDGAEQRALLGAVTALLAEAPPYTAHMPKSGKAMSVRMSNAGALGWYSDQAEGYRYIAHHPETGRPWPVIPDRLLGLWREYSGYGADPECCLINLYSAQARMGLHQDRDEADFSAPVLSVSLGQTAQFRLGGVRRGGPTRSFPLQSGDVMLLGGQSRLAFHGVDRIKAGSSRLLADGPLPGIARINLTLRRVTPAPSAAAES